MEGEARGEVDGEARGEVHGPRIWLVSYPKSGNTWFRFVLFHLLFARMPASSRELDAHFNSRLPAREGERLKKSHARRDALLTHLGPADKVVYLHRHPLDVVQSALNYAVLTGEIEDTVPARDAWVRAFVGAGGNPEWLPPPFEAGTWRENVSGWLAAPRESRHVLSFEAALGDPSRAIAECARYVGLSPSPEDVEACARATSFEALRDFEEREIQAAAQSGQTQGRFTSGARLRTTQQGKRFFHTGRAGAYRDRLSASEVAAAWPAFADLATSLGYAGPTPPA